MNNDIQKLITDIRNAIFELQETEHKITYNINQAMDSNLTLESMENNNVSSELNFDTVATSAFTAGGIGGLDKATGLASINGLLGSRTNTVNTGYNRETRRALGLAKTFEVKKPLVNLREGLVVGAVTLPEIAVGAVTVAAVSYIASDVVSKTKKLIDWE